MIAFVLSVIFSSAFAGQSCHVSGLMSANTGRAPQYSAQFADAANVIGVVMTSSPAPTPAARQAMCSAAVPLLQSTAYFAPVTSQSFFSASSIAGPQVRKSLRMTAATASMSDWSTDWCA